MAATQPGKLDALSKRVIARALVGLTVIAGVTAVPVIAGRSSLLDAVAAGASYCSMTALLWMLTSGVRGEQPASRSLSGWDGSILLLGVSALLHGVHRLFV